jgi:ubiquinone/menaquinone biosynthesis C-methylase UbiE
MYERSAGKHASRIYQRVTDDVAAADLPPEARILDVGTGPGLLPLRLSGACPQLSIDAVDLSPEMIERARHNAIAAGVSSSLTFTVGDVAHLPYPDASFDLVVSSISQHHWADPRAGMAEFRRVLRPGAAAWIYDFRWALRRAQKAVGDVGGASAVTNSFAVTKQSPLPGESRFSALGRLIIERA